MRPAGQGTLNFLYLVIKSDYSDIALQHCGLLPHSADGRVDDARQRSESDLCSVWILPPIWNGCLQTPDLRLPEAKPSAAGHAHETHQLLRRFDEFVAFRLHVNCRTNRFDDLRVASAAAQHGAEINAVFLTQTQMQDAIDR